MKTHESMKVEKKTERKDMDNGLLLWFSLLCEETPVFPTENVQHMRWFDPPLSGAKP